MASSGRSGPPLPLSLNPHHQNHTARNPLSSFQVASLRGRLQREIAALRVESAHRSLRSSENKSLFVKLSQLANLDEHYPSSTATPLPRTGDPQADAIQRRAALSVARDTAVEARPGRWNWADQGVNPNFEHEGAFGPRTRVYPVEEDLSPDTALGRGGIRFTNLTAPRRDNNTAPAVRYYADLEMPPRHHDNTAAPSRHRTNAAARTRYHTNTVAPSRRNNNTSAAIAHLYNTPAPSRHHHNTTAPSRHHRNTAVATTGQHRGRTAPRRSPRLRRPENSTSKSPSNCIVM